MSGPSVDLAAATRRKSRREEPAEKSRREERAEKERAAVRGLAIAEQQLLAAEQTVTANATPDAKGYTRRDTRFEARVARDREAWDRLASDASDSPVRRWKAWTRREAQLYARAVGRVLTSEHAALWLTDKQSGRPIHPTIDLPGLVARLGSGKARGASERDKRWIRRGVRLAAAQLRVSPDTVLRALGDAPVKAWGRRRSK